MMEFYCANCNTKLTTTTLFEVSISDINNVNEEELLAKGEFVLASKLDFYLHDDIKYLVNANSVLVKDHSDKSRLHGCCGPGDLEKINQVCENCSHELGNISGDCLMPHFIGISEKAIRLKPLW